MVFALLLFFAATGLAVFVLRRKSPGMPRPYRTWGYPVVPLIFIVMCLAVFSSIVISQPLKSAAGAGLLLAGFPVYLVWKGRGGRNPAGTIKKDTPETSFPLK
jgi:APA family basic amino acid/polyamine antiporter